jgi:L-ribulokinase
MTATIGFDFGTNSVRCLIVDIATGAELGTAVHVYETGEAGVITDPADHNLARQNPADYLTGMEITTREALAQVKQQHSSFASDAIIGIGVDTTGSTPLPLDKDGVPLAMRAEFKDNPNAHAWLWKDHTSGFSVRFSIACEWIRRCSMQRIPGQRSAITSRRS